MNESGISLFTEKASEISEKLELRKVNITNLNKTLFLDAIPISLL